MANTSAADWENIPNIIPRTISALSRDIGQIQTWINKRDSEESVASIARKITQMQQQIATLTTAADEGETKDPISELRQRLEALEIREQEVRRPPEVREVQMQTVMTADDFIPPPTVSSHVTEENEETKEDSEGLSQAELNRPRMLSLITFKNLVFKHLSKSRMKVIVQKHEEVLPTLTNAMDRQEGKMQEIIAEFQREIERVYAKFEQEETRLEKICADITSKFKEINRWSESTDSRLTALRTEAEKTAFGLQDLQDWYERTKVFLSKLDSRIEFAVKETENRLKSELESIKTALKHDLSAFESTFVEKTQHISAEIDKKIESKTEKKDDRFENLSSELGRNLQELRSDLEGQLADYRNILESDLERIATIQREEKSVSAEWIRTQGVELKKIRMELDKFVSTYVEPKSVSDARLYATEARIKEEEIQRLEEMFFIKDVIKKLVFSIEQNLLTTIVKQQLPQGTEVDQNVTLFVKRLTFLKKIVQVPMKTVAEGKEKTGRTERNTTPIGRMLPRLNRTMIEESSESSFVTQGSVLEHKYKDMSTSHSRGQSKEI